jgi:hypothetical protein
VAEIAMVSSKPRCDDSNVFLRVGQCLTVEQELAKFCSHEDNKLLYNECCTK